MKKDDREKRRPPAGSRPPARGIPSAGEEDYARPLFTIGIAAELLEVSRATLRIWERKGLIAPERLGKNRYYSPRDIERLREIKGLLRKGGMNIAGVKAALDREDCWEIKRCGRQRLSCSVYRRYSGRAGREKQ